MINRAKFNISTAHLKVGRARHHLDLIRKRLAEYAADKTFAVVVERDETEGLQLVKVVQDKPIDLDEFSLMAGDCIHNLRSAVDHAVVFAALHVGMTTGFKNIKLPTGHDEASFNNQCEGPFKHVQWFAEKMKSAQVFPQGQGGRLYYLAQLNNLDKHQFIFAVMRGHVNPVIEFRFPDGSYSHISNSVIIGGGDETIWAAAPLEAELVIQNADQLEPLIFIDGHLVDDIVRVLENLEQIVVFLVTQIEKMLRIGGHINFLPDYLHYGFLRLRQ